MASFIVNNIRLTEDQQKQIVNAFGDLFDGLYVILRDAIRYAHDEKYPAGIDRANFRKEFWKNLFLDKDMRKIGNIDGHPNNCPDNPYAAMDVQCMLKYLYFGGGARRLLSGTFGDTNAVYCTDQDIVFDCFGITYSYRIKDNKRLLIADSFSKKLNDLIELRNLVIGHDNDANRSSFVFSDYQSKIAQTNKTTSVLSNADSLRIVLEFFCEKEWEGRDKSLILYNAVLAKIFDNLGEINYSLDSVCKTLGLFSSDKNDLEQLLIDSDLNVKNNSLIYKGNFDELLPAIIIAWKAVKQFSFEEGVNLLKKLVIVLQEDTKKRLAEFEKLIGGVKYNNASSVFEYNKLSFEELKKEADRGDAEAQYRLGLCYLEGKGTNSDRRMAHMYFKKSANQGNSDAMVKMGEFHERGDVAKLDFKEAFEWYRKAADLDNSEGYYHLGLCYENQIGVETDKYEAFLNYETATHDGHKNAEVAMGRCYFYGHGCSVNKQKSKEIFERLADEGIAAAKTGLGMFYESEDILKAIAYYEEASDEGDECAAIRYELCRRQGRCASNNNLDLGLDNCSSNEARALFPEIFKYNISGMQEELLRQNYPPAMYKEAEIRGGEEGEELLIKAADVGYVPAKYKLCDIYLDEQNRIKALRSKDLKKYFKFEDCFKFALFTKYPNVVFSVFSSIDNFFEIEKNRDMLLQAFNGGSYEAQKWLIEDVESGTLSTHYPLPNEPGEWICEKLIYASKCGNEWALTKLIDYYKNGFSESIDKKQILFLSNFSHYGEVMFKVGELYEQGTGDFEQDISKAISYYDKARMYGHVEAKIKLADFYEQGKGVKKDLLHALYLYEDASEDNSQPARLKYDEIKSRLTQQELEEFNMRFHPGSLIHKELMQIQSTLNRPKENPEIIE